MSYNNTNVSRKLFIRSEFAETYFSPCPHFINHFGGSMKTLHKQVCNKYITKCKQMRTKLVLRYPWYREIWYCVE